MFDETFSKSSQQRIGIEHTGNYENNENEVQEEIKENVGRDEDHDKQQTTKNKKKKTICRRSFTQHS